MIFSDLIFPEPSAVEDKPAADALPPAILSQIENLLSARITGISVVYGGFSPSAGYRMTLDTGDAVFVKGSHPGEMSHATESLRQEIRSYRDIAILKDIAPACHGVVGDGDEDGWLLGIWDFIEPQSPPPRDAKQVVDLLVTLQSDPAGAAVLVPAVEKNFIGMFFTPDRKWQRLRDDARIRDKFLTLFDDADAARAWFDAHIGILCALQEQAGVIDAPHGLIHGDLRLDNIVHGRDGKSYVIDWPNACCGPMLFDTVFLAAHMQACGITDMATFFALHAASGGHHTTLMQRCVMMAAISGFFADQAYRAVPERLPRLRWMQKSMLASLLAGLAAAYADMQGDSAGFAPPPRFSL